MNTLTESDETKKIQEEYVTLNARGKKILTLKHLINRSTVLKNKLSLFPKKDIYINRFHTDVHNLIDCLSGYTYSDNDVLEELMLELKIDEVTISDELNKLIEAKKDAIIKNNTMLYDTLVTS